MKFFHLILRTIVIGKPCAENAGNSKPSWVALNVAAFNCIFMRHNPKARVVSTSIEKREWDFNFLWSFSIVLFDCSIQSLSASLRARSTSNLHVCSINIRSPSDEYSARGLSSRENDNQRTASRWWRSLPICEIRKRREVTRRDNDNLFTPVAVRPRWRALMHRAVVIHHWHTVPQRACYSQRKDRIPSLLPITANERDNLRRAKILRLAARFHRCEKSMRRGDAAMITMSPRYLKSVQ